MLFVSLYYVWLLARVTLVVWFQRQIAHVHKWVCVCTRRRHCVEMKMIPCPNGKFHSMRYTDRDTCYMHTLIFHRCCCCCCCRSRESLRNRYAAVWHQLFTYGFLCGRRHCRRWIFFFSFFFVFSEANRQSHRSSPTHTVAHHRCERLPLRLTLFGTLFVLNHRPNVFLQLLGLGGDENKKKNDKKRAGRSQSYCISETLFSASIYRCVIDANTFLLNHLRYHIIPVCCASYLCSDTNTPTPTDFWLYSPNPRRHLWL